MKTADLAIKATEPRPLAYPVPPVVAPPLPTFSEKIKGKLDQCKRLFHGRQILVMGSLLTAAVIAVALLSRKFFAYHRDDNTDFIDCYFGQNREGVVRDFKYYQNAVNARGRAVDQYCLAEAFKSGFATPISLSDARLWYKEAADQGLTLAKQQLCQPEMFEHKFLHGTLYSEFRPLCCVDREKNYSSYSCPWDDKNERASDEEGDINPDSTEDINSEATLQERHSVNTSTTKTV